VTRPARLVAACAVAVVALSACGGSPVRAGAAAVVGSERITTSQLSTAVDDALASPAAEQLGQDRPALQRELLGRLVEGRVLDEAAAREGVGVTAGQVDEQYAAIEQSVGGAEQLEPQAAAAGYTLAGVRELARREAVRQALGDRLTADVQVPQEQLRQAYDAGSFDQVRTAMVQVATLAEAQALLPQAQGLDDAAFAQLASTRSLDEQSRANGGDIGLAPRSAFTEGLEAYGAAAFAARVGDTFAVASPSGGHVVRVLERRTTSFEDATPQLRRTVLQEQRTSAVQGLLTEVAADLGVTVNPRFGSWDAAQQTVVERVETGDRELSRPADTGEQEPAPAAEDGLLQPEQQQQ
jgi:peptidyl-prolyl cis-trans isomerase C